MLVLWSELRYFLTWGNTFICCKHNLSSQKMVLWRAANPTDVFRIEMYKCYCPMATGVWSLSGKRLLGVSQVRVADGSLVRAICSAEHRVLIHSGVCWGATASSAPCCRRDVIYDLPTSLLCPQREGYIRSSAETSSVPKCDWKKSLLGNRRRRVNSQGYGLSPKKFAPVPWLLHSWWFGCCHK